MNAISPRPDNFSLTSMVRSSVEANEVTPVGPSASNVVAVARNNSVSPEQPPRPRTGNSVVTASAVIPALEGGDGNDNVPFDSTGMFHWCPPQDLDDCLLSGADLRTEHLIGHILVCVNTDPGSAVLGLRSFVMPLRASNFHFHELKE